jgi:hypothetical protein
MPVTLEAPRCNRRLLWLAAPFNALSISFINLLRVAALFILISIWPVKSFRALFHE